MRKSTVHPDEVLQAILAIGPRSDKAANLKALHEICRGQYEAQNACLRDFTLTTIGRLGEAHGLFKARVLYNAASRQYVELIAAWAAFSGPLAVKLPKQCAPLASYQYLTRIEDPAVRALVQAAIAERDDLRAKVNLLKSKIELKIDMRPLSASLRTEGPPQSVREVGAQLTDSERVALQVAVSEKFLADEEWTEGSLGEVTKRNGRVIFGVGYLTGLRKILGL